MSKASILTRRLRVGVMAFAQKRLDDKRRRCYAGGALL